MASAKLYLDKRSLKKDGTAPIKIVISNKGGQAHINTGVNIPPACWKNGKVVNGAGLKQPSTFINTELKSLFNKVETLLEEIAPYKCSRSASNIRDLIVLRLNGNNATETKEMAFAEAYGLYTDSIAKKTSRAYANTVRRWLIANIKDSETMPLSETTALWVENLKDTLLDRLTQNSACNYLSMIKSSWHWLQKHGYADKASNPFEDISIRPTSTRSRALTIEEVREIWYMEAPEGITDLQRNNFYEGRDMFRLLIGLEGINSIDLTKLTNDDIHGERLECDRSKTGIKISIRIEPEVREILDKYTDEDGLLIGRLIKRKVKRGSHIKADKDKNFPQSRPNYRINYRMKMLDERLTTYWMRHTWASLCAELDIPDRTISMGLAHSYGNAMDNVYITNRYKKLDAANRKVLDWIQQKGEFASQE